MSKSNFPLEFIIHAQIGDAILNRVATDLIADYGNGSKEMNQLMLGVIKSNDFIKDWPPILKVKFIDVNKLGSLQKTKIMGDIIEASISFLYLNRGIGAAERYVKRNIINSLQKI